MSASAVVTMTGYERCELLPAPRPTAPLGPSEVQGSTLATLVSAGTEVNWCFRGKAFPAAPGYAAVFRVEQVGEAVTRVKPGDVAFCMGPHRGWQRATEQVTLPVPAGLVPAEAAFARLMGVSMSTLTTTAARPPQRVLVTGLGPVGHLAARIFDLCGYAVTACDPVEGRRAVLNAAGVADVRAAVPLDDPTVAGRVALALECAGAEPAALDCCRAIRKRGEVVLVGTPWRRYSDLTAFDLTHAIFHQYAVVRSGWEWEVPLQEEDFRVGSLYGNIAVGLKWLADGRLSVRGLYQTAPPGSAQQVYAALADGTWPRLAAVFEWPSE